MECRTLKSRPTLPCPQVVNTAFMVGSDNEFNKINLKKSHKCLSFVATIEKGKKCKFKISKFVNIGTYFVETNLLINMGVAACGLASSRRPWFTSR